VILVKKKKITQKKKKITYSLRLINSVGGRALFLLCELAAYIRRPNAVKLHQSHSIIYSDSTNHQRVRIKSIISDHLLCQSKVNHLQQRKDELQGRSPLCFRK
jgi:hypothetical protein